MSDTNTATISGIAQIGTVIVPVTDQDRALEFYTQKLGFEKRTDVPFGPKGERWIEVAPAGAATTVAIVPPREGEPVGIQTRIGWTTDDAEASRASLQEQGVDVDAEVAYMGDPVPPMFFYRDQDNNTFMVVQRSN